MTTLLAKDRHAGSSSSFVSSNIDASRWENIAPLYQALIDRPIPTAEALTTLLLDRSELDAFVNEAEANLYITMTCHTDDEKAQKAYLDFVENVEPQLRKTSFELDRKIAQSAQASVLDKHRYEVLLRTTKNEVELFRDDNVAIQTEITKLDQQYSQINGAMTVQFQGQERTMPQMARFLEETDRSIREQAWRAIADRRLQERDNIDDIFDKMIRLRDQMAKNAGFKNFRDYQHRKLLRFDYSPTDCEKFHQGAEQVVVPVLRKLNAQRAAALNVNPLRPWDLGVDVKGRQPLRPFQDADDLVTKTSDIFNRMDSELGAMFDELRGGGCLDLESRKGKRLAATSTSGNIRASRSSS